MHWTPTGTDYEPMERWMDGMVIILCTHIFCGGQRDIKTVNIDNVHTHTHTHTPTHTHTVSHTHKYTRTNRPI